MKTYSIQILVLFFFASLSLNVFAQSESKTDNGGSTTSGDNLMPMTINGPKAKTANGGSTTSGDNLMPMTINGPKANATNGGGTTSGDNLMPMSINSPKAKTANGGGTTSGDNLMSMTINGPKANALFGFIQAGTQSAKITLHVGKNTLQFPGIPTQYTAEISENFVLISFEDMLQRNLVAGITPFNAPEAYTDPGSARFYALSVPTADGKVVKGILAIGLTGNNPFAKLPDPLPYWPQ